MIASEPKPGKIGESQHWYTRDGKPAHDQPNKSKPGETRPTTLRDARTQLLLPSVSSILGVMAKKGLEGWMKEQVADAAWNLPNSVDEYNNKDLFIQDVLELANERMTKARDLGTEIHGAIERYLEEARKLQADPAYPFLQGFQYAHSEHVGAAVAALKELGVWGAPFESERTFASHLGWGGTVDYMTKHYEGDVYPLIADFKCVDRLDKKLTYPDRCAQLRGYEFGTSFLNARLVNIFISTSEPGKYLIHEWSQEDKNHAVSLFFACFELWKVVNKYDPSLAQSS